MILRRRRDRVEAVERAQQDARAEISHPRAELARGLIGADGERFLEQHVARVHARIHLEGRDARLRLAADDGPRDGRRAAIARQEGGVDVDRAAYRHIEHGLGKDLAEGDDDGDFRAEPSQPFGPLRIAQAAGLNHGDAGRVGATFHGRRHRPLTAAGGSVGLGHDRDDVMPCE